MNKLASYILIFYMRLLRHSALLQIMIDYLFDIVEILYNTDVKQSGTLNGKRMASALTIICCIYKIVTKMEGMPFENVAALLSMLCLMPDAENQVCVDWDIVNELLPKTMNAIAFEATHSLMRYLSRHHHFLRQWLFALPVLHFLNGTSQPFQPAEYKPQDIPWGDRVIGLGYIKDLIKDKEIG